MLGGDGSLQVLERINDNAYKMDLLVSTMFHLEDKSFEEGGNDTSSGGQIGHSSTREQDGDFNMPIGPIKRARVKRLKEGFGNLTKSFVEEMHQEWVKEEKTKLNRPNIKSG